MNVFVSFNIYHNSLDKKHQTFFRQSMRVILMVRNN
jgi:hypothetical protein